tara:strand:- start:14 stop:535 length:522 start_codon:yes stop_codon:yes gene_type:complete
MDNFYTRIKKQLTGRQLRGGSRANIEIPTGDLLQLLERFETLDADARAKHGRARNEPRQHLADAITALFYQEDRSAEEIILIIMETLLPLTLEEKRRRVMRFRDYNQAEIPQVDELVQAMETLDNELTEAWDSGILPATPKGETIRNFQSLITRYKKLATPPRRRRRINNETL